MIDKTYWFVPDGYNIAISCEIVDMGILDCWIDEPVGHAVYLDELFETKEDAAEFIRRGHSWNIHERKLVSLDDYREIRVKFIVSTFRLFDEEGNKKEQENLLKSFPKKSNDQWFNVNP